MPAGAVLRPPRPRPRRVRSAPVYPGRHDHAPAPPFRRRRGPACRLPGLRGRRRGLGDEESWAPSGCTGWAVRDLVFHCVGDARRALVALHTPAEGPPDRDAVTYWRDWGDDPVGAADGRRFDRVAASMFLDFRQLRALYLETAAATVRATAATPSDRCVATQGHVLTVGDLMATLAVEAAVHHLDLVVHLPDAPDRPRPPWRRCAPPWTDCSDGPHPWSGRTSTTRAWAPAGPRSPTPNGPPWAPTRTASRCSPEPASPRGCLADPA